MITYEAFIDRLDAAWKLNPGSALSYMSNSSFTNWRRVEPRSECYTHHACYDYLIDPEDEIRCIDLNGDQVIKCVKIMNSFLEAGINSIAIFGNGGVKLGFFSEEDAVAARAYLCL